MKKRFAILAAVVLMMSLLPVNALARGHHGGRSAVVSTKKYYAVCPYEDCDNAGTHRHDGVMYRCRILAGGQAQRGSGGCCGGTRVIR